MLIDQLEGVAWRMPPCERAGPIMNVLKTLESWMIACLRRILGLSRSGKFAIVMFSDAVLCLIAVWIAFSLRLGEWVLWNRPVAIVAAVALISWIPISLIRGIYQSVVRFVGTRTLLDICTSCLIIMALLTLTFMINSVPGVPRTVAMLQPLVFASLLVISRLVGRYVFFDLLNQHSHRGQRSNVLIYGAGSAGRQLSLSLRHEPSMVLRGYVDDDSRLAGKHLDGVTVHGAPELETIIARYQIELILLAVPSASRQRREQIVRKFENLSVRVLTLPAIGNLIDQTVSVSDLREIEVTDLLGRDPVPPDQRLLHSTVEGRTVMITGAGGSIGSELCRQIGQLKPSKLVLVEMTEHALYLIDDELRTARDGGQFNAHCDIYAELGNVADAETVSRLFNRWRPDTVFHAAAYKHVPLVEENAVAGMRNNIFGTYYCAREADRVGVNHFILVSTDKAVRPTNIMGASKRVCELVLQAYADHGSSTRFAIVRFGNVLGSSGSVVPRFQKQIRDGGPVTLTHRDVTRYFMTIPEAAQLVIQAGAMAEGGEVYVLNMGDPIRIYDLARTMINLSGLSLRDEANADGDIEIREIGLRKGEKLYEELLIGNSPKSTLHPRIMQAREDFRTLTDLVDYLSSLSEALAVGDRSVALLILSGLVPEYSGNPLSVNTGRHGGGTELSQHEERQVANESR